MSIPQETLDLLGPDFVGDVGRYVFPIFTDNKGAPESIGSAFLLQEGAGVVLITAAHVLDWISRGHSLYFYVEANTKRAVTGRAFLSKMPPSGDRNDDVVDLGVVILEGEGLPPYPEINKDALSVDRLAAGETPRTGRKYAFFGYPASQGKVHRPKRYVSSKSYAFLGSSVSIEQYAALGLGEASHIVLAFNQKDTFHPDGTKMNFPKPQGISGAPLWELRRQEDGGPVVVGVMIEHRQKEGVVVATDIGLAFRLLTDALENLGGSRKSGPA